MAAKALSILIADDDDGDRKQVKRAIKKSGISCEISESANMAEAISTCEKKSIDCVILDYLMPDADGLQGISMMCKQNSRLAIIMVTGHGNEAVASEAIKRGAVDYIKKSEITADSISRSISNAYEKVLLQRKVDEQQESLENFSRILVQDISVPLNKIRGFSELMAKSIEHKDYENVQNISKQIEKSSQRMQEMIDALEEYNKLEESKLNFTSVSIQQLVLETVDLLEPIIRNSNAKVTYDALPEVTGNAPRLRMLLQNLILNAIKYCDEPVPSVHICAGKVKERWCFSIEDNGIGIPEKYYHDIFIALQRLDPKSKYSGLGIGLTICKKIVEQHSGEIWCESEVGKGTTFYFTLNANENENAAETA